MYPKSFGSSQKPSEQQNKDAFKHAKPAKSLHEAFPLLYTKSYFSNILGDIYTNETYSQYPTTQKTVGNFLCGQSLKGKLIRRNERIDGEEYHIFYVDDGQGMVTACYVNINLFSTGQNEILKMIWGSGQINNFVINSIVFELEGCFDYRISPQGAFVYLATEITKFSII